ITGINLNLSPDAVYLNNTNAGTATAGYEFLGDQNHTGSTDSTTFEIEKAEPVCTITGYSVNYDTNSHTATGECLDVNDDPLAGLDLSGTTHTDAGSYVDSWNYTDATGNYNDDSGTVNDSIGTVNLSITASSTSRQYSDPNPTFTV